MKREEESRMAVVQTKRRSQTTVFGPDSNGILMTPWEFDRADFEEGWCYELINGVLIVTPIPFMNEVDPNEYLGYLLRRYEEDHPQGKTLNATGYERHVRTGRNRRRADRLIWAGLGRLPRQKETPTIAVEFTSKRKRDRDRDYVTKRDEYLKVGVKEYWVIDRFEHTLTVYTRVRGKNRMRVFHKHQAYTTDLLPGFELPLARLFELADRWPEEDQPE
jgi:Uma2 family endonuclease